MNEENQPLIEFEEWLVEVQDSGELSIFLEEFREYTLN